MIDDRQLVRRREQTDNETVQRRYQPTAKRMTSGSNCRHLNRPQTEDARRSIRPAYREVTAKLQHFGYDEGCSDNAAFGPPVTDLFTNAPIWVLKPHA
jgi:hypothetical protein